MWRGRLPNLIHSLLSEILLRVILLGATCIMHLTVRPHVQYITEAKLLNEYRRPILDSYVPVWGMIVLIIFVPLLCISVSLIFTKNYLDATHAVLSWTLALAINAVITETVKLIVGRPRPDFFYRCFPNEKLTPGLYCTGNDRDVSDGRMSFPSGHSSFSFCSLGFVSIWLCGKLGVLSRARGEGWRVMACLPPLLVAVAAAISRCCDYHHHWEDVLVGSVLGFTIAYFCYLQYYHPLDSVLSGRPFMVSAETELFLAMNQIQCCTKDLNNEFCLLLRLYNKNTLEINKKSS